MGTGSSSKKHQAAAYDPQRKWGLAPRGPGDDSAAPSSAAVDGATYVVAGHIVASGKRDLFMSESVGREAQARAARKAGSRDVDKTLKRLLSRDKEGMKAVQEARAFAKKMKGPQNASSGKGKGGPPKSKRKEEDDGGSEEDAESGSEEDDSDAASADKTTRSAYSAHVIQQLGFDPASKSAKGRSKDDDAPSMYSKVCFFFLSY